jgi:hypothetical protein
MIRGILNSPLHEAESFNSSSTGAKSLRELHNPKVHYRVHNSPPLGLILCQGYSTSSLYVCMHVCMYVYVCMYIYIYVLLLYVFQLVPSIQISHLVQA